MKRIGLICGGFSSEYDISIKSAHTIQKNFPPHLECILIEISRENWQERLQLQGKIDAALIYTHGDPGENGKIQAFLDMLQIPFVNSDFSQKFGTIGIILGKYFSLSVLQN
jgi:D-alanine-D-alanine ligase